MNRSWLMILLIGVAGCAAAPWTWQDVRSPPRASAEADLAACRSYASAQYSPGTPAGDPYLNDRPPAMDLGPELAGGDPVGGTWRPDREPFPYTNRNQESIHGVIVPYTGYPGELDYHPDYLDALVEKCMADRGWAYRPAAPDSNK